LDRTALASETAVLLGGEGNRSSRGSKKEPFLRTFCTAKAKESREEGSTIMKEERRRWGGGAPLDNRKIELAGTITISIERVASAVEEDPGKGESAGVGTTS